jgi:sec-independent protein translocase protein TatB
VQERRVLDLSLPKLLLLGVLALIIFGPDQLPRIASQAGKALRDLRRIADNAKTDLTDNLGPEFKDFDVRDLNPRHFVRKHLTEEFNNITNGSDAQTVVTDPLANHPPGSYIVSDAAGDSAGVPGSALATQSLQPGESPPYDSEAT